MNEFLNKKSRLKRFLNVYIILPALILIFLSIAAYTGSKTASMSKGKPGALMLAIRSDPQFLNPVLASDSSSMFVNSFIFNTLVKYDRNLNIAPEIAQSWETLDNGKKIIFHIRRGIKWHDGKELTASDCVFTFNKILDPKTNTFNGGLFKVGEKPVIFSAPDDYTLVATLPQPFAPFLNNLTLIGIVPRHILENENINSSDFTFKPVGTGPFKFSSWKTSDQVELISNPLYFKGKPKLEKVIFKIIPSAEGQRIALLSRQIDVTNLSPEDLLLLEGRMPPDISIVKWEDKIYYYLGFDLENPFFSDIRTRQAINHSIDTKAITEAALHGTGSPIYGPIPKASWAYTDKIVKYAYDPQKAGKLLDEAGWKRGKNGIRIKNGVKFSFKINYVSGSYYSETAAVYIQSFLRDAGIETSMQPLDYGALIKSLYPGKFDSVIFDWEEALDPDNYTEWHSSQMGDNGMNFMSYKNPSADKILEEARATFDREKRKKYYHELQRIISGDAPYVFLWNQDAIYGVNKRVRDLAPASLPGIMTDPEKIRIVN